MVLLMFASCSLGSGLMIYTPGADSGDALPQDTHLPATQDSSVVVDTGTPTDTGEPPDTDDPPPGPRLPSVGDLVITELMINPSAVSDDVGEWVEIYNVSADDLDLSGLSIGDEGVDGTTLTFSSPGVPVFGAGEYGVFCASATLNGGVTCQGTYVYRTSGGGLALSNSEDEVILRSASGTPLDTVRYNGTAPTGASLGVEPGCVDAALNDNANCWCPQRGTLPEGDQGSPGRANGGC